MIANDPKIAAYIRRVRRREAELLAAAAERASPRPDPLCTTTLGEFGVALLAADLGEVGLSERTQGDYFSNLFGVVETALRHEDGFGPRDHRAEHYGVKWHAALTPDDYPTVVPILLTQLGAKTIDAYQQGRGGGLGEKSEPPKSVKNTMASQIAQAKAAFNPTICRHLATEFDLYIPSSIQVFRDATCYKLAAGSDEPPHERYVLAGHMALRALLVENRVQFIIVLLALFFGLTRREITAARREWIVDTPNGPVLRVWRGSDMERDVPASPWAAALLRQQPEYLIPGELEEDRAKCCNLAVDYLRKHGFADVLLPLKRLEECCAWYFASCSAGYSDGKLRDIMGYHPCTLARFLQPRLSQERCDSWEKFSAI